MTSLPETSSRNAGTEGHAAFGRKEYKGRGDKSR